MLLLTVFFFVFFVGDLGVGVGVGIAVGVAVAVAVAVAAADAVAVAVATNASGFLEDLRIWCVYCKFGTFTEPHFFYYRYGNRNNYIMFNGWLRTMVKLRRVSAVG